MATSKVKSFCSICNDEQDTYECKGCLTTFCFNHLTDHREMINQEFIQIEHHLNLFRERLDNQKQDPKQYALIEQIDRWEQDSINKIQETAQKCRDDIKKYLFKIENQFNELTQNTKEIRKLNKINEINSKQIQEKLNKLSEEFEKPEKIPFNKNLHIDSSNICFIERGCNNHRIVEWKLNSNDGQIVAGENKNQLKYPSDVIVDKENNSLIIADVGNKRVIRWSRQKNIIEQILISNIDCDGLTMDKNESLYVSDSEKNEVRRWNRGDQQGTIVAGGNGRGDRLDQLNLPTHMFVDEDYSLFVSDSNNSRVMKWIRSAKEGTVVAGGNGQGNRLTQLSGPRGVIVDRLGHIYVADCDNHRVILWSEGCKEGTIVVGGNGSGEKSNQLNFPVGLSFDEQGNLYVADCGNNRIQKFEII